VKQSTPGSVIWAAGVTGVAPLETMTDAEWWEVLAPKVAAAATTREMPNNSNIVLFVCVSAAWGGAGAAHYAAANAFLDALAVKRSAQGSSTLSIRFGPFSGSGMIGTDEELVLQLSRQGDECECAARPEKVRGCPCCPCSHFSYHPHTSKVLKLS